MSGKVMVNDMDNPTNMKATKCVVDTKYAKTTAIIEDMAYVKHVTNLKDGDHYCEHAVNLANIDKDTMKRYAISSILIQMRTRILRAATGKEVNEMDYTYDPTEYQSKGGFGITNREREIRMLTKRTDMTEAQAEYYLDHSDEFEIVKKPIETKLRKNEDNE